MKMLNVFDSIIYWSIIVMPFTVAIAPGLANTFIGFFCAFFLIKKIIKREKLFTSLPGFFPFLALVIVSLVSFRNSVNYHSSFQGIIKLLKCFLIIMVCSQEIKDIKQIKLIVVSICSGIALVSIDAIWQLVSGFDFINRIHAHSNFGLPRASASFPNPNVFGVYISALVPLAVGLALFYYKRIKRLIFGLISAMGAIAVATTLSRGTGLAFYFSTLFLAVIKKSKLIVAFLLIILVVSPFLMPQKIKDWAKEVNYSFIEFMCNPDRVYIYKTAVNMVKAHPFVGVGVNTFSLNYGKYKIGAEAKGWETGETKYAHNIYLQMAGEVGLLGLLSFLCFLFIIFRNGFLEFRKLNDEYLKVLSISLLACVAAFLINGLTETSLYYARVSMIFWYIIGFSLALNNFIDVKQH